MRQDPNSPLNASEFDSPIASPDSVLPDIPSPTFLPPQNAQQKPTLILELDKVLIKSTTSQQPDNPPEQYDFIIGYEIDGHSMVHYVTKRPGLDDFLEKMSSMYELVIFTETTGEYAAPVVDQIDPRGYISHRLYRDSCVEIDGEYVKDLSQIGREVPQMIMVDNSQDMQDLFPEHVIWVREFVNDSEDEDDTLVKLGKFLEDCSQREDLRDAVAEYAWW